MTSRDLARSPRSLYAEKKNSVNDFANKILWLLENPHERRRMGEFGRKRIEEELAWKYSVPNLLAAYQGAFSKRESRPPKCQFQKCIR
jgi:glycosyltransferase involved in cell wall biosynthesis